MPEVGLSYKQQAPQGAFDVIVIGSGMGGLAAAAFLARLGKKRVLVLERHYTAGGFTHSFKRPGYEWDVGIHYIGQVGPGHILTPYFDFITRGELKWAPLPDVYDRAVFGERSYDFVSGIGQFSAKMKGYFPGEEKAIDRYIEAVLTTARRGPAFYGERVLPGLMSKVAGAAMKAPYLKWADRSARDVIGSLTKNAELINVLTTQCGDYGLPPSQASFAVHAAVVGHYLEGAWFPVGGAASIARHVEPVIAEAGGAVFINADVERVLVEGGRAVGVRMADGRELRAPLVISDVGARLTYGKLLPSNPAPPKLTAALGNVAPSVAHACLYIGLKHTAEELGLTGTNLWIYPESDHEAAHARYLKDPDSPLPIVYASFPSAKDPTFLDRHPGRATIDLITLVPWDRFASWQGTRWKKRGDDYDSQKAKLAERMLEVLYKQVPQVRGKIDFQELSTPITTQHFAAHPAGEIYGLDHTPARFRLPLRAQTHVPGLFLTGSDLVMCGVAGALFGGVLTSMAILKKNVIGAVKAAAATR